MKIVTYPDPGLSRLCKQVTDIDRIRDLASSMFEVMYNLRGVGLAAPQVGLAERFFLMNPSFDHNPKHEMVVINPRIMEFMGSNVEDDEGCLSVPGVVAKVLRRQEIEASYMDLDGRQVTLLLSGFPARIFQHESDHLDGLLFTEKMSAADQLRNASLLRDMEDDFSREK